MSEITGTIIVIEEAVQVTATFRKRLLVIETVDGTYKETIPLEFCQDKADLLDNFSVGQEVTATYSLKGRAWNDPKTNKVKYFPSIQAWKLEAVGGQPTPPPVMPPMPSLDAPMAQDENGDDVPF